MLKSIFFKQISTVVLVVYIGIIAENQLVSSAPNSSLIEQILTLGDEDVDYRDYGEFGYNFAPAVSFIFVATLSLTRLSTLIKLYT